ncbi:MAG: hypothetical protein Q7S82_02330, partial [bacterium]|nr:hypothetical protein [bacterium]
MPSAWKKTKKFFLDLFFPKFCLNCQKEGDFLCEDCKALLEISPFHRSFPGRGIADLYIPLSYQNPLVKSLIRHFKYEPFVKELATTLASLIISHFQLLDNKPDFTDYIIIPIPLSKKRLKWRGYNQSEELGKELAEFFKIPSISNCLVKTKETAPQMELAGEARKENVKGIFLVKNSELIRGKKILLIDDVYTTGSTME